eukprot:3898231-Karenia_brevis.AAC.1
MLRVMNSERHTKLPCAWQQGLAQAVRRGQVAVVSEIAQHFRVDFDSPLAMLEYNCDGPDDYEDSAVMHTERRMDL